MSVADTFRGISFRCRLTTRRRSCALRGFSIAGALTLADTWLRQWRGERTQVWCARAFGISRNRWSEIERGATPSGPLAVALTKLTAIAVEDFHRRDKLPPRDKRKKRAKAKGGSNGRR